MIKESNLNKYYAEIANKLNQLIPVEWKKIIMYNEELDDYSNTVFYFYTKEDNIHHSRNIPEDFLVSENIFKGLLKELDKAIDDFRNEFKKENEKLWHTLTFTLNENWLFKVKFGYEIDKKIGTLEREIIWAYNEIGLIPQGKGREVLIKYLNEKREEIN